MDYNCFKHNITFPKPIPTEEDRWDNVVSPARDWLWPFWLEADILREKWVNAEAADHLATLRAVMEIAMLLDV